MYLKHPLRHKGDVGGGAVAVGEADGFDKQGEAGVKFLDAVDPAAGYVALELPDFAELGGGSFLVGPFQSGVVGAVGVGYAPGLHEAGFDIKLLRGEGLGQAALKGLLFAKGRVDAH